MACYQKWIQQLGVVAIGVIASTLTLADATAVSANELTNSDAESLQQESWQLVRYNQQPIVVDDDVTIHFDGNGRIGGFDSCNHYSGSYQVQGDGQITIALEGRTLVNCIPEGTFSAHDHGYLLPRVTQYSLTDNLLRLETPEGDLVYAARPREEDAAEVGYEQWLAESMMPLLDADSPERVVSREEFVFVLEAIALRVGQSYREEADAVTSYCETHAEASRYLERRISSFESESERLIARGQTISAQPGNTSPLRPLWQRKQNTLPIKTPLSSQQNNQADSTQVERNALLMAGLPSDISSTSYLAGAVEFLNYLFTGASFEDGTFRPDQPVTHGELIEYFSRQETPFTKDLAPSEPEAIEMNYAEAGTASERLSVVLGEVNEVRSLVEELRGAISSSKNSPQLPRPATKERQLTPAINPTAHTQIAQSNPIPSIIFIEEIPDVSATDAVYTPLRMFVEEIGIDMIQSDGHFNGNAPLTRGELAQYLEPIFFKNAFFPITEACERASNYYLYWSQQTQTLQSELRQAISELD